MFFSESLDTIELACTEALEEQYLAEHALTYYASYHSRGETKSKQVGDPDTSPQQFSLKTMTSVGFSLSAWTRQGKLERKA